MGLSSWPVIIPAEYEDRWQAATADQRDAAAALAGRVLWTLTGQVFGVASATVRPCFDPYPAGTTYQGGAGAVYWPGIAVNPAASGPCGCSTDCGEVGYDRLALPGPVAAVDDVMIDGVIVDPTTYRVDSRRWLHRIDGERWPTHQNLHAPDDAAGAFTVHYQRGVPVPADGQAAAGRLAVELLASATGGACQLPPRVTSASRQGQSIEVADIREWFAGGLTGVEQVDLWIMAVNPYRSRRPGRIISPDRMAVR